MNVWLAEKLCAAVENEDPEAVANLLLRGADPNCVLSEGVAAIHLASGRETETGIQCLKVILQHGGNPNIRSLEELTPLHVAASWGCYKCLKLLLRNGGDPALEDQDGKRAVDLAEEQRNHSCVQILEDYYHYSLLEESEEEKPKFQYSFYKSKTQEKPSFPETAEGSLIETSNTSRRTGESDADFFHINYNHLWKPCHKNNKLEDSLTIHKPCRIYRKFSSTSSYAKGKHDTLNTSIWTNPSYNRPKSCGLTRLLDSESYNQGHSSFQLSSDDSVISSTLILVSDLDGLQNTRNVVSTAEDSDLDSNIDSYSETQDDMVTFSSNNMYRTRKCTTSASCTVPQAQMYKTAVSQKYSSPIFGCKSLHAWWNDVPSGINGIAQSTNCDQYKTHIPPEVQHLVNKHEPHSLFAPGVLKETKTFQRVTEAPSSPRFKYLSETERSRSCDKLEQTVIEQFAAKEEEMLEASKTVIVGDRETASDVEVLNNNSDNSQYSSCESEYYVSAVDDSENSMQYRNSSQVLKADGYWDSVHHKFSKLHNGGSDRSYHIITPEEEDQTLSDLLFSNSRWQEPNPGKVQTSLTSPTAAVCNCDGVSSMDPSSIKPFHQLNENDDIKSLNCQQSSHSPVNSISEDMFVAQWRFHQSKNVNSVQENEFKSITPHSTNGFQLSHDTLPLTCSSDERNAQSGGTSLADLVRRMMFETKKQHLDIGPVTGCGVEVVSEEDRSSTFEGSLAKAGQVIKKVQPYADSPVKSIPVTLKAYLSASKTAQKQPNSSASITCKSIETLPADCNTRPVTQALVDKDLGDLLKKMMLSTKLQQLDVTKESENTLPTQLIKGNDIDAVNESRADMSPEVNQTVLLTRETNPSLFEGHPSPCYVTFRTKARRTNSSSQSASSNSSLFEDAVAMPERRRRVRSPQKIFPSPAGWAESIEPGNFLSTGNGNQTVVPSHELESKGETTGEDQTVLLPHTLKNKTERNVSSQTVLLPHALKNKTEANGSSQTVLLPHALENKGEANGPSQTVLLPHALKNKTEANGLSHTELLHVSESEVEDDGGDHTVLFSHVCEGKAEINGGNASIAPQHACEGRKLFINDDDTVLNKKPKHFLYPPHSVASAQRGWPSSGRWQPPVSCNDNLKYNTSIVDISECFTDDFSSSGTEGLEHSFAVLCGCHQFQNATNVVRAQSNNTWLTEDGEDDQSFSGFSTVALAINGTNVAVNDSSTDGDNVLCSTRLGSEVPRKRNNRRYAMRFSFSRLTSGRRPSEVPFADVSSRQLSVIKDCSDHNVTLSPGGRPVNTTSNEVVEYLYTDIEEGHALIERHMPCFEKVTCSNDSESSEGTIIYNWTACKSKLTMFDKTDDKSITPELPEISPGLHRLSNDEIFKWLQELGEQPGPVTDFTRKVYLQKLDALLKEPCIRNGKVKTDYNPELAAALEKLAIPDCNDDEMTVSQQFDKPDKNRRWREGVLKSSFNYLLLDPRVTRNLPARCRSVTQLECFKTFISSIFYIGKGKRARPYSHLYDALKSYKSDNQLLCSKVQLILDVWNSGLGVVSLHCFQNVIPVEAYTREACMIDAIGLKMLTNQKKGDYYGVTATWTMKRRRQLGVYLLHKALQIFLAEGERQLRPADL